MTEEIDFSAFSPTDYRYAVPELREYLSEEAYVKYKAKVEAALAQVFANRGMIKKEVCDEIIAATSRITAEEVYEEERKTKHDIRALVKVIQSKVSDEARPFVHLSATSYDVVDTANALRYKDAVLNVIIPDMLDLERTWIRLARREKDTVQIGRTHGQHAEPITFGFALAHYVNRWGSQIVKLREVTEKLVGKFSGAVGAYNATSLLIDNPEDFEREVLALLNLKPAAISTQIVPPEPMSDFLHVVISSFSVLANFCDDMRHLQRSEIGEVMERVEADQVGSSTMPHKRNPIGFESVKSLWKKFMPQVITMHLDQISEHQRDLTNSASQRYIQELLVVFDHCVRALRRISERLEVDRARMQANFLKARETIIAEPLYILLSRYGHPDAHEYVRRKSFQAYSENKPLKELVVQDAEIQPYVQRFTKEQTEMVFNAERYIGRAAEKTEKVARYWDDVLEL
ncbi:MAG: adenylosuccinate lyase [Methanophagales archaeon ANME-1-THS]|nr:MAG: adenylosuccinate lyase [Methanophagales archaeon ANME-1-THS]